MDNALSSDTGAVNNLTGATATGRSLADALAEVGSQSMEEPTLGAEPPTKVARTDEGIQLGVSGASGSLAITPAITTGLLALVPPGAPLPEAFQVQPPRQVPPVPQQQDLSCSVTKLITMVTQQMNAHLTWCQPDPSLPRISYGPQSLLDHQLQLSPHNRPSLPRMWRISTLSCRITSGRP